MVKKRMQEEEEAKRSRDKQRANEEAVALRRIHELEEKTEQRAHAMEKAAQVKAEEMREKAEAMMRESEIAAAVASNNDSHQRELAPSRIQEQKEERKKNTPNGPP
eukprot:4271679-Pyramimonas_sp.AAC.1